jgi:hypothetical protein
MASAVQDVSPKAALAAMRLTATELSAARELAELFGYDAFDPTVILAFIEMIRNLIAGCKKQETADPADAQYAAICALHGYGSKARNKRVRAAARRSLDRDERTEENVDKLLESVAMAPEAKFAKLWASVRV